MAALFQIKRVYDAPAASDGTRVLVDRLWPRGLAKEEARADHWMKELAPSSELREWFGHDSAKWIEFRQRYAAELEENAEAVDWLRGLAATGPVTLLYAASNTDHNNAVALRDYLEARL